MQNRLVEHKHSINKNDEDMPEIRNWQWGAAKSNNVSGKPVGRSSKRGQASEHHHHRPAAESRGGGQSSHVPYWKRAHTDWRLWVGVVLMFIAMIVYVMSEDLAWRPGSQARQPHSAPVAK